MLALLKGLAQRNSGLCLATTRYTIDNLKGYAATAPQRDLPPLSAEAGARLLAALGVKGTRKERLQLAADMKGHALTLEVVGGYLRDAHGGDIRKRDLIEFEEADAEVMGGHAFRAMAAYARWFEGEGEKGQRALAMLRLTGLFDRPAEAGCLAALWRAPAIEGLTEALVDLSEAQRNVVLKRLEAAKLLTVVRDAGGALLSIDAHPLLREYFARELRKTRPEAWQAAHRRLYEHLTTTEDKEAPTLDDLQPLYHAVAHGCLAGLWQEVCHKVYFNRVSRGKEAYVVKKLGAFGADLGAVACFFDPPWRRVSSHLTPVYQAWLLNEAGYRLRALGRLAEAREPLRAALEMAVAQESWEAAAVRASNLSELELTLGEVGAAARDGETAVAHAERSGDAFRRMADRTTHADALHQAGRRAEAEALFAEAEAMQAEREPQYPLLYSLQGFQYCDLWLGAAERAAWRRLFSPAAVALAAAAANLRGPDKSPNPESFPAACDEVTERARQTLTWAEGDRGSLLDISLDHLTLARAALYGALPRGESPPAEHVNAAVDRLRRAGAQHHLPRGLLTRALYRAVTGDFDGAREDLDEAFEIAERGPMRLHLTDIRLHRARLFGLSPRRPPAYPWTSPRADLAEARKLIETCGYGRRLGELEDAEAALQALSAPTGPSGARSGSGNYLSDPGYGREAESALIEQAWATKFFQERALRGQESLAKYPAVELVAKDDEEPSWRLQRPENRLAIGATTINGKRRFCIAVESASGPAFEEAKKLVERYPSDYVVIATGRAYASFPMDRDEKKAPGACMGYPGPGMSISHRHGWAGTLGAFVEFPVKGRKGMVKGFASASHVLRYPSDGKSDDEILSPGPPDGNRDVVSETIGYLRSAIALVHYQEQKDPDRIVNKTDIALAEMKDEFGCPDGNFVPVADDPDKTMRLTGVHDADNLFNLIGGGVVCTIGRTTGFARGHVLAIAMQGFPIRLRDNKSYLYGDIIVIEPEDVAKGFSAPGDSGAAVYTDKGVLVGFVVAGSGIRSFVQPAVTCLRQVNARLI